MEIIKLVSQEVKTKDHTCRKCRTEFRFNNDDVQYNQQENDHYVVCPSCGSFISVDINYFLDNLCSGLTK